MDIQLIKKTLEFYNPWWKSTQSLNEIPVFRRDIYENIFESVNDIRQIVSITGPRRVGKTTILRQLISDLIFEEKIDPLKIIYLSMDDPYIYSKSSDMEFFDNILSVYEKFILRGDLEKTKVYFFIDEVHKFKEWELFLKKYYDRGYNIKFIISGSVSHSILGKSQESLAGRIKNFKVYTFSFYEYLFYKISFDDKLDLPLKENLLKFLKNIHSLGKNIFHNTNLFVKEIEPYLLDFKFYEEEIRNYFYEYLVIGGFIESWSISGQGMRYEYLYQTQIEKVLLQDIYILEDIKNTKLLASLFFKFSENFVSEFSLNSLVKDLNLHRDTTDRYINLLIDSNLIFSLSKYEENLNKNSNIKVFLSDIGIRNSILKLNEEDIIGNKNLFLKYIENLVLLSLVRYSDSIDINYYREREKEINFILKYSSFNVALSIDGIKINKTLFNKFKFEYIFNITMEDDFSLDSNIINFPFILFFILL